MIESPIFANDKDGVLDGRRCRHTLDGRGGRGSLGDYREGRHGGNCHGTHGRTIPRRNSVIRISRQLQPSRGDLQSGRRLGNSVAKRQDAASA